MAARTPDNTGLGPSTYLPPGSYTGLASEMNPVANSSAHYFATTGTADTWTIPNWTGPLPETMWFQPDTVDTAVSPEWALSGTSLVVTLYADNTTSGYLFIEQ